HDRGPEAIPVGAAGGIATRAERLAQPWQFARTAPAPGHQIPLIIEDDIVFLVWDTSNPTKAVLAAIRLG
ncbi:MAG: hypothetical protein ACREIR_05135, partial [Geminicoccaceae bacterium]